MNHVCRQIEAEQDATQPEGGQGAEDRDRRAEKNAERNCPAFIQCSQNKKNEQKRKPEDHGSGNSLFRLRLLIGHPRPVVTHLGRHGLLENFYQGGSCLIGAVTWRGICVELGGPVFVITHGELRAGTSLEICQRRERYRLALVVAHVELPKILRIRSVRRFGLHINLPGTAEIVVVIDEQAAHVRLNGVIDIGQSHPLLQHFVPVHIDVLLWHARHESGADHADLRALSGGCQEFGHVRR